MMTADGSEACFVGLTGAVNHRVGVLQAAGAALRCSHAAAHACRQVLVLCADVCHQWQQHQPGRRLCCPADAAARLPALLQGACAARPHMQPGSWAPRRWLTRALVTGTAVCGSHVTASTSLVGLADPIGSSAAECCTWREKIALRCTAAARHIMAIHSERLDECS